MSYCPEPEDRIGRRAPRPTIAVPAGVLELAYRPGLGPGARKSLGVRIPPPALGHQMPRTAATDAVAGIDSRPRMADTVLLHSNRDKAESKATKAAVAFLLLVSAGLVAVVTLRGWSVLQGAHVVSFGYIVVYLLFAWYVARWNRGVLPVAAALAILARGGRRGGRPGVVRARQGRVPRPRARE